MKNKKILASLTGLAMLALYGFKSINTQEQYITPSKKQGNYDYYNQLVNQNRTALTCSKCHDCTKEESTDYENVNSNEDVVDQKLNLNQNDRKNKVTGVYLIEDEFIYNENPDNFKFLK